MHVHDELVLEVPESEVATTLSDVKSIMSTAPEWIPDIPLAAEAQVFDYYTK
jgi:DNA polymerase